MKINDAGLVLLKQFEGCRLKAYKDVIGVWTIGFGHTGSDVHPGLVIDQPKADELLEEDLQTFEDGIENAVEIELTDNQFSALVDFTYNVGLGNFLKSHLLRYINASNFTAAAGQFIRWNKAGGVVRDDLTRRRLAEKALFLKK